MDTASTTATSTRKRISTDFYFDLVCPWCMIGKRQLEHAIDLLALGYPDVDIDVRWKSLPLLPDMPMEGKPFQAFYLERLGGAAAVETRRQQIREAGTTCGIRFDFERIEWMPNTIAAHRLVELAGQAGGSMLQSQLIDELFRAYFLQGRHIGELSTLADIGQSYGLPQAMTLERLASPLPHGSLDHWQSDARRRGMSGVPGFVFGNRPPLTGALAPQALAQAMLASLPR